MSICHVARGVRLRPSLAEFDRRLQNCGMNETGGGSSDFVVSSLRVVLLRDLRSLDDQIAAYPDDKSLWQVAPGISNSAGNLALHLVGNLRHFFGATLGGSGYVRDRPAEFAARGVSRDELRTRVQETINEVDASLEKIDADTLASAYPLPIGERSVRTAEFLVHLAVHLTYHLGQIDYHRRLLTPAPKLVDNVSIRVLPEAS
jgi:uncharacterized damage-inducible protein DinB